jgi:hypothetical protein
MAVTMKISVVWDVAPVVWQIGTKVYEEPGASIFRAKMETPGSSKNVHKDITDCMGSHPRRQ